EAAALRATIPVQVDFDLAKVAVFLFKADARLALVETDLAQVDRLRGWCRRGRWRRRNNRTRPRVVWRRNFDAEVLGQRFQATGKPLTHAAELPLVVAAIELTQDQCRFSPTLCGNRGGCAVAQRHLHVSAGVEAGTISVDGRCEGDFLDGRLNKVQIQAVGGDTWVGANHLNCAALDCRLAVEAHVAVTAYFARGGQQEGRDVNLDVRDWRVVDRGSDDAFWQGAVRARSQDSAHAI